MSDRFSDRIRERIENASIENLARRSAHAALGFSAIFATLGFVEDGYPSEAERADIFYCAASMAPEPRRVSALNFPEYCSDYRDEFKTDQVTSSGNEYTYYTLPSHDAFIQEKIWTSHIEEERAEDFGQSFAFLSLALGVYGVLAFRRRMLDPQVHKLIDEVEQFLRTDPRDR